MAPVTVRVLHGTGNVGALTTFDPAFAGGGEDQMGSGFYFTDLDRTAWGYTVRRNAHDDPKPGGEDDPGVIVADVTLENPIHVPAGTHWRDAFPEDPDLAERLVLRSPTLLDTEEGPLTNWDDVSGMDEDDLRAMAARIARETYSGNMASLEVDFFPGAEGARVFREALHELSGHDGVVAPHGDETHYVAWFPEQIAIVEVLRPDPLPAPAP